MSPSCIYLYKGHDEKEEATMFKHPTVSNKYNRNKPEIMIESDQEVIARRMGV